jgi:hypothetical protein
MNALACESVLYEHKNVLVCICVAVVTNVVAYASIGGLQVAGIAMTMNMFTATVMPLKHVSVCVLFK